MASPDTAKSSSLPPDKRGWALDTADATVRVKPRRPYTPYNLFYLLERELVVQGHEPSVAQEAANKKSRLLKERSLKNVGKRPEEDISIPSRYKNVILLPYWYEPNLKEKRKHRKTHGKISFKELTGIISKNWANIDAETKEYCTNVSLIGRKSYKETITRYNAAQKIIQLKAEHAAMENAREQRMDQLKKNTCLSPPNPEKGHHLTPDRIPSCRAPIVVTPPRSGYNVHRAPTFAPSGAHAFHQYGPPPPLPPPMPPQGMPGQHPPSMRMYHHHQQQHLYRYHQAPATDRTNAHGYNQGFHSSNNGYHQDFHSHNGHHQSMKLSHVHSGRSKNSYLSSYNQGSGGVVDAHVRMNKEVHQGIGRSVDVHERRKEEEKEGMGRAVDVHVRAKRVEKTSMSHDEALHLCDLIGNDAPAQACRHEQPQVDPLLCGIPSFDDFGDHHSLSSEDNADSSEEISFKDLMSEVENQGDNFFDLFDQD